VAGIALTQAGSFPQEKREETKKEAKKGERVNPRVRAAPDQESDPGGSRGNTQHPLSMPPLTPCILLPTLASNPPKRLFSSVTLHQRKKLGNDASNRLRLAVDLKQKAQCPPAIPLEKGDGLPRDRFKFGSRTALLRPSKQLEPSNLPPVGGG
jgi:hypothetical protein